MNSVKLRAKVSIRSRLGVHPLEAGAALESASTSEDVTEDDSLSFSGVGSKALLGLQSLRETTCSLSLHLIWISSLELARFYFTAQ